MVRLNRRRFLQKNNTEFLYFDSLHRRNSALAERTNEKIALVLSSEVLVEANAQLPFISTNAIKSQQRLARAERKLNVKAKAVKRKKWCLVMLVIIKTKRKSFSAISSAS